MFMGVQEAIKECNFRRRGDPIFSTAAVDYGEAAAPRR